MLLRTLGRIYTPGLLLALAGQLEQSHTDIHYFVLDCCDAFQHWNLSSKQAIGSNLLQRRGEKEYCTYACWPALTRSKILHDIRHFLLRNSDTYRHDERTCNRPVLSEIKFAKLSHFFFSKNCGNFSNTKKKRFSSSLLLNCVFVDTDLILVWCSFNDIG